MKKATSILIFAAMVWIAGCSDKSIVPGDDPYYDEPQESQEAQKLDEEEQYVDMTPTLNEEESGDSNLEYTMPPPDEYDE